MNATMRRIAGALAVAVAPWASAAVSDGADCGGFTAAAAAAVLKAPVAQVTREVSKSGDKWTCTFAVGKSAALAYSVAVAPSAKRAAADLERYRDRLSEEAATARWKDRLPNGVYSDMMGMGDEAVWTDIDGSFTVRRDNVTVQFTLPRSKDEQVRIGKAVVAGF